MQSMSLIIILMLAFGGTSTVDVRLNQQWKLWKENNDKHYSNSEENIRRSIWENNLEKVQEHNLQADLGFHTYWLGMNQFADMSVEEFVKTLNADSLKTHRTRDYGNDATIFKYTPNMKLPETVDWREKGYVTPVKDQGQLSNLCFIYGQIGALEGQHFNATGKPVSLSEQNVFDCANSTGTGYKKTLLEDPYDYIIRNHGVDSEYSYSWKDDCICRFERSDVAANMTNYTYAAAGDEKALQQTVALVGPISVALDGGHTSFQLYKRGIYNEPLCSQTMLDHSGLIAGYGVLSDDGSYWLVKNSWGTSWGQRGYIMMSRDKHNQCGIATTASFPIV